MKSNAVAASMLAKKTSGLVNVLFLRVDFQPDTDPKTTGDGTWTDPTYSCTADIAPGIPSPVATFSWCINNPYDYWVNRAKYRFISYYNEVSYGALQVQVTISPTVYRLPKTMSYPNYGEESNAALVNFVKDSIAAADADIDFSLYDAVLIVHAGPGEETDIKNDTPNDIWSLYYSFTPIATNDGVSISEAIIMPQTGTQDGQAVDPFGIYAHEFGHWLGLPDLYDTARFPLWDGIGKWGLMGDGIYLAGADGIRGSSPAHFDAWCKKYLGWVTPDTLSTFVKPAAPGDPGITVLAPVETNQRIIKLPASNATTSQYFLLENRQLTGFDSGLPGSGLLVWLIDEDVINANLSSNTVNSNPARPGVALIEADGNNALKSYGDSDYGSDGDPFPGRLNKTLFTPYTTPSSTPYSGSAWLYLKDISVLGSDRGLTIGFAPAVPSGISVSQNTPTVVSWSANAETDLAGYNVYKNGVLINQVPLPKTQTQYTDTSSVNGDRYTVTAVDDKGYESARSAPAAAPSLPQGGNSGPVGVGGCFIATAAYGSYEAPYVRILREFRDTYLLTNNPGKTFVGMYYKISPTIADFIRESDTLRAVIRVMLLPLIGVAAFLVKTTIVQKSLIIVGVAGTWIYKRKRQRPPTHS